MHNPNYIIILFHNTYQIQPKHLKYTTPKFPVAAQEKQLCENLCPFVYAIGTKV